MSDPLARELEAVLARLRREHDVLPFLQQLLPSIAVQLSPLPRVMLEQLRTSPDFASIRPGDPVWINLASAPDISAEIVLYRCEANGQHYIIAPAGD